MSYEQKRRPDPDSHSSAGGKPAEGRFAPLTAGLLARKGEAEPSMEPFKQARVAPGAARQMEPGVRHDIERLANGEARAAAHVEPINDASDVREEWQRLKPAVIIGPPAPAKPDDAPRMKTRAAPVAAEAEEYAENCPRRRIAQNPKRAAVTFRMSVHDFLRLKLASAELERSSQDIIIDAVEAYLDQEGVERLDDCKCLREAAKACADGDEE